MKKMKIVTNKGGIFDKLLNAYINFTLWKRGIKDDEKKAVEVSANIIKKINKVEDFLYGKK
jgi:hypothetical protein